MNILIALLIEVLYNFGMGSINATRLAGKVVEKIRKGELVNLEDLIVEVGYSKATAKHPTSITRTIAYRKALAIEQKPLIEGLQSEINRIKLALSQKDLTQEDVRSLVYMMDIYLKNYQLLSGGATERQVFVLPAEVMQKNSIESNQLDGSTKP